MNDRATEAKRKRLKEKDNVAWKIVRVNDEGEYQAPFSSWAGDYIYDRTGINITVSSVQVRMMGEIWGGVFHCFTTRSAGRGAMKALKSKDHFMSQYHMKLVKVLYDREHFYGIGNAMNFSDIVMAALKDHKNNTTCVKAFTFPEN